jgi:diadenylate cyclase
MIHGDVSADLLRTIFAPRAALHDGAVIIRGDTILAAGALLPLAETTIHTERFGTRHRAALGITEQTDAIVVVVSEENGQVSLVERARIVRNLNEAQLARAIKTLLGSTAGHGLLGWRPSASSGSLRPGGRAPRLSELGRFVSRNGRRRTETKADRPAAEEERAAPARVQR